MADIAAIRKGLAANLAVIPDVQVYPYVLSNPTPTTIYVVAGEITFDLTFGRGIDRIDMEIQLFTAVVSDIATQVTLDQYRAGAGPLSVKQAIEADRQLGGVVQTLQVEKSTRPHLFTGSAEGPLLMCEFVVPVWASGLI